MHAHMQIYIIHKEPHVGTKERVRYFCVTFSCNDNFVTHSKHEKEGGNTNWVLSTNQIGDTLAMLTLYEPLVILNELISIFCTKQSVLTQQ